MEAQMRLAEKAAALESVRSPRGVPTVNESSTALAEKFYTQLLTETQLAEGAAGAGGGGGGGSGVARRSRSAGGHSLAEAVGVDVFERLSSPIAQLRGHGSRSASEADASDSLATTDDRPGPDAETTPAQAGAEEQGRGYPSPPAGRREVTSPQRRERPPPPDRQRRARSAQRARSERAASPESRGQRSGRQWRSVSAQRADPRVSRARMQQYGRYANRLNTGLETQAPTSHDSHARLALLQRAEQARRLRRAQASSERRRALSADRSRQRSAWGPPPSRAASPTSHRSSPRRRRQPSRSGRGSSARGRAAAAVVEGGREAARLAAQLEAVQAQLAALQSSEAAHQAEVRSELQHKTQEAAELRAELGRVQERLTEAERGPITLCSLHQGALPRSIELTGAFVRAAVQRRNHSATRARPLRSRWAATPVSPSLPTPRTPPHRLSFWSCWPALDCPTQREGWARWESRWCPTWSM